MGSLQEKKNSTDLLHLSFYDDWLSRIGMKDIEDRKHSEAYVLNLKVNDIFRAYRIIISYIDLLVVVVA